MPSSGDGICTVYRLDEVLTPCVLETCGVDSGGTAGGASHHGSCDVGDVKRSQPGSELPFTDRAPKAPSNIHGVIRGLVVRLTPVFEALWWYMLVIQASSAKGILDEGSDDPPLDVRSNGPTHNVGLVGAPAPEARCHSDAIVGWELRETNAPRERTDDKVCSMVAGCCGYVFLRTGRMPRVWQRFWAS